MAPSSTKSGIDGKKKGVNKGPKDFKRKTAKVGRKVKRDNVTEIKVAVKHIHIPLQNAMVIQAPADERATLEKLYKQLKHYSDPTRLQAITQLAHLVASSEHTESYISILVPKALELLFDEDGDIRKVLLNMMTDLVTRHSSEAFASIISVIITYLCSGLTSLSLYIRRDSLALLGKLSESHAALLKSFAPKLTLNVAALAAEATAIVDQAQSKADAAVPNSRTISSPRQNHKMGNKTETGKYGLIGKFQKLGKEDRYDAMKVKSLPDKKASYLLNVLQVLRSLARLCNGGGSNSRGVPRAQTNSLIISQSQHTVYANGSAGAGAGVPTTLGSSLLTLTPRLEQRLSSQAVASTDWAPHACLEQAGFFAQMRILWLDMCGRNFKISVSIASILMEIAELVLTLSLYSSSDAAGNRYLSVVSAQLQEFTRLCFMGFPFSLQFQATATNSEEDRKVFSILEGMDLTLCQIAFAVFSSEATKDTATARSATGRPQDEGGGGSDTEAFAAETMPIVISFLLRTLSEKTAETASYITSRDASASASATNSTSASASASASTEATPAETDSAVAISSSDGKSGGGHPPQGSQDAEHGNGSGRKRRASNAHANRDANQQQELLRRLWLCLERVIPCCVSQAEGVASGGHSVPSTLWSLANSLRVFISDVGAAVVSSKNNLGADADALFRPAVYCVCQTAVSDAIWAFEEATRGFVSSDIFSILVDALVQLPAVLLVSGDRQGYIDDSICLRFCHAVHTCIVRCDSQHKCMPQLCACILDLFRRQPRKDVGDKQSSSSAASSSSFYAYCSSAARLRLIDLFSTAPYSEDALAEVTAVVSDCVVNSAPSRGGGGDGDDAADGSRGAAALSSTQAVDAQTHQNEKKYFLSIFLHRRADMTVDEVLDGLFRMLRGEMSSRVKAKQLAASSMETILKHLVQCAAGQSFGGQVAATFYHISSSHAPTRILRFITPELEQMLSRLSSAKAPRISAGSSSTAAATAPADASTGAGSEAVRSSSAAAAAAASAMRADLAAWIVQFQTYTCVLRSLTNVASPLFQRLCSHYPDPAAGKINIDAQVIAEERSKATGETDLIVADTAAERLLLSAEDQSDVLAACRVMVRVAILSLTNPLTGVLRDAGGVEQLEAKRAEGSLAAPFISCLVTPTNNHLAQLLLKNAAPGDDASGDNAGEPAGKSPSSTKFAVFRMFLNDLRDQWQNAHVAERWQLLRTLKRVLEHDLAMGACMALRAEIYSTLTRFFGEMPQLQDQLLSLSSSEKAKQAAGGDVQAGAKSVTDADVRKLLDIIR